jgi:DNA-binding NarL/FixJ family response regulator
MPRNAFVETIRILLVGLHRLMSDIVELGLQAEPDIEIVGVLATPALLPSVVRAKRPDLLVVGTDGTQLPEECGPVFAERPDLRMLGIQQEDMAEAAVYELRPHCVPLGQISPSDLAVAIRRAAGSPARLWKVG